MDTADAARPRRLQRDAFDVIVVGSGVGGLTTAALLAKAGRQVLVLESHDRVGGYAHAFRRGPRYFDSSVHLVGAGVPQRLLSALGVADACQWLPADPVYTADFPGLRLRAPAGIEAFIQVHLDHFPGEEKGIRGFVQECRDIREEIRRSEVQGSWAGSLGEAGRFPSLRRFRRATLSAVMDAHIENEELRAVLSTLWPYLGLPPSRVSFLYWATMLLSYVEDGALYCRGTFQRFARALAKVVEFHGGECRLRSAVRRILVSDGVVAGVELRGGEIIRAPVVVSGADLHHTVFDLVGPELFPRRYVEKIGRLSPSASAFVVYSSTRLDLAERGLSHENFFYPGFDHDSAYRGVLSGEPTWFSATIPTLLDPGLAPRGENLVVLMTLATDRGDLHSNKSKPFVTDWLLDQAEQRISGFRDGLMVVEAGSPQTMKRYTRNQRGALYGFDVSPDQVGPGRPDSVTMVPGLFLAGHWTRPGGGIVGVVTSGIHTARGILEPGEAAPLTDDLL